MANNIFVRIPKRGDAVVGRLSDKKIFYISAESYTPAELDPSAWETQGVVSHREGREVHILALNRKSLAFCNRPWFYISGYKLDGQAHTIVFSIASSADWGKRVDKSVTYNASEDKVFVKQLNDAFSADDDFTSQDWYANMEEDGRVRIHFAASAWQQYSNTVKSGANLTSAMPEFRSYGSCTSKNGGTGYFLVLNMARATAYYRNDNGYAGGYEGGLTADVTSVKRSAPINLPTWLGTSTKNPGDFCSYLRDLYGEGENGWIRFMASCQVEKDSLVGHLSIHDGADLTKSMSKFTYTSRKVAEESPMCQAAAWCSSYGTQCLPAGSWYLPSMCEIAHLVGEITYGTSTSMDILNKTIGLAGGSPLSNGQHLCSCVRASGSCAWGLNGGIGCINNLNYVFNSGLPAAPLALQVLDI